VTGEGKMYNLLIVDDEMHLVDSLAESIGWGNFEIEKVYRAYSGDEALEILKTRRVDIVITDIRMPGISGLRLIEEIQASWKRTKCIYLSGYADFNYAIHAMQNGAVSYLIKPALDEEIIEAVKNAVERLKKEYEEMNSMNKIRLIMKENMPFLKARILNDMLQDSHISIDEISEDFSLYGLEFSNGDSIAIMLIRIEDGASQGKYNNLSLLEYGIVNLTEEILGNSFELWYCKDCYDYMVFLIKQKREGNLWGTKESEIQERLKNAAIHLKHCINSYLKATVSMLLSRWGSFPEDVYSLYKTGLSDFRRMVGTDKGLFFTTETSKDEGIQSLKSLYEPPSLTNLLEAGRWDAVSEKITSIFIELNHEDYKSKEHLLEVFSYILSSISYIIHRNGKRLEKILAEDYEKIIQGSNFHNVKELHKWTISVIRRVENDMMEEARDNRSSFVEKVHEYVESHLNQNISLQAIADHVFLHPVYLSKLYKSETGDSLSNYIYKFKMEKARYLLNNSDKKIYEITSELGYQNPQYFSKVFKNYYGVTPQEYRES
jgi:two-component system, response regulator YesN